MSRITTLGVLVASALLLPTSAMARLALKAGASAGYGTMGNGSNVNPNVAVLTFRAMPGVSFGRLTVGAMAQYKLVGQLTDPAEVFDTNVRGSGYTLGGAIALDLGRLSIQGSYDFLGSYKLSNVDLLGDTLTFSKPSGFTFVVGYRVTPRTSLDASGSFLSYSDPGEFKESTFGLGLSLHL
jgi:hypothetical protein